jgi:hypothetical protein
MSSYVRKWTIIALLPSAGHTTHTGASCESKDIHIVIAEAKQKMYLSAIATSDVPAGPEDWIG